MSFSDLRLPGSALCLLAAFAVDLGAQTPGQVESGTVYLAYAGPHAASPPSAFGHLFLALPGDPEEPVPLWEVVSFAAQADDVGPLRFAAIGILGGFQGRYERRQFHELSRDYQLLEDRDLWLLEVKLSADERRALAGELERVGQDRYAYTFFGKNCAHYLQALLAAASSHIPAPQGITSPTGVMQVALESGLAGSTYMRPAVSSRVHRLAERLPVDVATSVRRQEWSALAADTAWISVRTSSERQFLQEYFSWKAQADGQALSDTVSAGLDLLRGLNAQQAPVQGTSRGARLGRPIQAPRFHRYTRVSAGYVSADKLTLRLRPGSHDVLDSWEGHRPVNTLELLTLEVSADSHRDRFRTRLEEFVLFSQRSLNPSTRLRPQASWMLEAVARREGVFAPSTMNSAMRFGLGHTKGVADGVFVFGLVTGATVTDWSEAVLAFGFEGGTYVVASPRVRLGATWRGEQTIFGDRRRSWMVQGFARFDLNSWSGVHLAVDRSRERRTSIALAFDWYP